jgi:CO/xanthine dehydrogenase Mo-binding subunit
LTTLGSRVPLLEGGERVRGQARYTADITVPGMLHARPVLSPHAHAKIVAIDSTAALAVPGVVAVLAAGDLAVRFAGVTRAHMLLAQERAIFCGQPVAVVVAETEAAAEDGAAAVAVDYDSLPASIDLEAAVAPGAPLVWSTGLPASLNPDDAAHGTVTAATHRGGEAPSNATGEVEVTRGDVAQGFRQADLVLENTYRTRIVHQGYLEPHASLAQPDSVTGGITIYSATQAQFMVRDKVAQILNLPVSKVRVVTPAVGGAFGGKFGIIDPLVAAVAWTLRRPVRMVLTRSEDFQLTTPAPQMVIRVKTGMTKTGALTAIDAEVLVDSGTHPTALAGLAAHAFGTAYKVPHLRARARGAVTHKPAVGSYRGPGGPQATFALESQIDEMARRLGLDPLAVRLQNAVDEGDPMTDGGRYPAVGLKTCLARLAAHPLWTGRASAPGIGYGLAAAGWLGTIMPACASCAMDADGTFTITVGSTDMTGAHTTMALIAADVFNVSSDRVRVVPTDTGGAAYAGPSAGSMVTRTVGAAVLAAAKNARKQLIETAAAMLEANPNDLVVEDGGVAVRGAPGRRLSYQEIAARTRSYNSPHPPISAEGTVALHDIAPCFIVELARVQVDPETGNIRVLDWIVVQDVGRALNPLLIEGQIHGGVIQAQGLALAEQLAYDEDGRLVSGTLADYALSKAADAPRIAVDLAEVPAQGSPFGARGVGEPSIIPGAAAIANAVRDACGARVTSLPITPQALWKSLQALR